MKKFNLYSLLAILTASMIVGCGGSSSDTTTTPTTTTPTTTTSTVDIGGVTYHAPSGVTVVEANIVGANAKIVASGDTSQVSGFVQEIPTTTSAKNSTFFARIQGNLADAETAVRDANYTDTISMLTTQSFQTPYPFTIAQYKLVTNSGIKPLDLAGEILNTLAGGGVTGLPVADANSTEDTNFRFVLLYATYEGTTFYIAVVVPESKYNQFEVIINAILNASNMTQQGASLQSATENFTYTVGSGKADFLFVVDNSGSMSDDQDALAKAAKDFTAEMSNSGLLYRSAIITTCSGADNNETGNAYSILREHGIIENNNTLLEQELVAGTSGSATETGIWNSEQALQSLALGDTKDGGVTAVGMPKTGASLSVIIISDEDSQYTSRSSTGDFNVSDNLFIDRNITVYSIIKPGYSYSTSSIFDEYNSSQYDDLSLATHGIYSDIENKDANGTLDYSFIMKQIAKDAGGTSSSFVLTNPAASITEVKVNSVVVVADAVNGYTYIQASHAIVFHGTAIPANGATIEVTYSY